MKKYNIKYFSNSEQRYYSHCIHNWFLTQEIGNSLNSIVLGLRVIDMMNCEPFARLLASSKSSVEVTSKFPPPSFPCGGLRRIPSLFGMPIFLAVAGLSHYLFLREGTMDMQCEHYTIRSVLDYSWPEPNLF